MTQADSLIQLPLRKLFKYKTCTPSCIPITYCGKLEEFYLQNINNQRQNFEIQF